jgi:hypothetical protein
MTPFPHLFSLKFAISDAGLSLFGKWVQHLKDELAPEKHIPLPLSQRKVGKR